MSFLGNIRQNFNNSQNTSRGLYLGTPEAEGETRIGQSLLDFFEDYMHIVQDIKNGKFIITGRKGAGKSAIVKFFKDNSSEENELYSCKATHLDVVFEKAIQIEGSYNKDTNSLLYEWIILTKFVKMLLDTRDVCTTNEYKALIQFQKKNSGLLNVDEWKTMSFESSDSRMVNFSPLKSIFNAEIGKSIRTNGIKASFIAFIPALRDIVVRMLHFQGLEKYDFMVMFDDLDINFKLNRPEDRIRILDLVRITRDYNTQYLAGTKGRVLIFLRDDVSDQLNATEADKNKLFTSYETRISWYDHLDIDNEERCLLRKFINKRIQLAFQSLDRDCDEKDPWKSLVNNTPCKEYNNRSAFKFILEFTFYLPRDLLYVFKDLENKDLRIPLQPYDVKNLLKEYVKRKKTEILDELVIQFDDSNNATNQLMAVLKELSRYNNYSMKEVLDCLNSYGLNDDVFSMLIDYNLLIPKDSKGNLYFKYREEQIYGDMDDYVFTLPKCLYHSFYPNKI